MKSREFLALSAALVLFAAPVFAKDEAPVVTPSGPQPKLSIPSLEHDFGKLKPGTPLEYRFQFKNEGKAPLKIEKVKPACGCTTSAFDSLIAPGQTGSIALSVKKTDTYKGTVFKSATVTTNDPDRPSLVLKLRATFEVVE